MAPTVSALYDKGMIEAEALPQDETFAAGQLFTRTEGLIAAPESCHAIASAIRHAQECKRENKEEVIVFNLSGHGLLDLQNYATMLGM